MLTWHIDVLTSVFSGYFACTGEGGRDQIHWRYKENEMNFQVSVKVCNRIRRRSSFLAMSVYKFCPDCNNILYPKEDKEQRILLNACRICDYQVVADNNRIYRNEVQHSATEFTQILQDVASDPTVPRTKSVRCIECGHGEAAFLTATSREEGMTLFYVCCNPKCGIRWKD